MAPLQADEVDRRLEGSAWRREGDAIVRDLEFGGFVEAIAFVTGRRWPKTLQQAAVLPGTRLLGTAAIATIPRDLRRLMGIDRPTAVDVAEVAAVRAALPVGQRLAPILLRRVVGGSIGDAYFLRAYRLRAEGAAELVQPAFQQAA